MNASVRLAASTTALAAVMATSCQESPTAGSVPIQAPGNVRFTRDGVVTGAGPIVASGSLQSLPVAAAGGGVVLPAALAGTMGNSNNFFPHAQANMRYQQLVLGSEIGGPMTIRELCIRPDDQFSSLALVQQITVKLGPTNLNRATLGAVFDANYSVAPTTVFSDDFSMPATGPGSINDWKACIEFSTAYRHDGGNLLIEVANTSLFQASRWIADFCFGCETARMWAFNANAPVAQFLDRDRGLVMRLSPGSVIPVGIDIKPGTVENPINPRSRGVVPVAILGSADFNVAEIDPTTLTFGPSGARPTHDMGNPAAFAGHLEDVNQDGFTDLISHYSQNATGLTDVDTEACIDGATSDGTPIHGCDIVRVLSLRGPTD